MPFPPQKDNSELAKEYARAALDSGATENFWSIAAAGEDGLKQLLMIALFSDHPKWQRARAFLAAVSMAGNDPDHYRVALKTMEQFIKERRDRRVEPALFVFVHRVCNAMQEHGMSAAQIIGQSDHSGRNIELRKTMRGKPQHKEWANELLSSIAPSMESCALEAPLRL